MNNPYQAPMMNNPYIQSQNPYMDRMNFLQNYQQSLQQQPMQMNQQPIPQQIAGINGRIVQAVENINANEVPMDGSMAFFPKQDMSEIYVKGWNADNINNFNREYDSNLSYPTTAYEVVRDACIKCDVPFTMARFDNSDYVINEIPSDNQKLTYGQVIAYILQLSGLWGKEIEGGIKVSRVCLIR